MSTSVRTSTMEKKLLLLLMMKTTTVRFRMVYRISLSIYRKFRIFCHRCCFFFLALSESALAFVAVAAMLFRILGSKSTSFNIIILADVLCFVSSSLLPFSVPCVLSDESAAEVTAVTLVLDIPCDGGDGGDDEIVGKQLKCSNDDYPVSARISAGVNDVCAFPVVSPTLLPNRRHRRRTVLP